MNSVFDKYIIELRVGIPCLSNRVRAPRQKPKASFLLPLKSHLLDYALRKHFSNEVY